MYEDIDLFDNTRGGYNLDNSSDDELNTMYKNVISARFGGKFISKLKENKQKNDDVKSVLSNEVKKDRRNIQPKSLSELLQHISNDIKVTKSGGISDEKTDMYLNSLFKENNDENDLDESSEIKDEYKPLTVNDNNPDGIFDMIDIPSSDISTDLISNNQPYTQSKLQNNDTEEVNELFKEKIKPKNRKKKGGYNKITVVDSSSKGLEYTKDIKREEVDKGEDKDYIKFVNEQKYGKIDEIGDPENIMFEYTKERTNNINKNKISEEDLTSITDDITNPKKSNITVRSKQTAIDMDKTINNIEQNSDNIDSLFKD